MENKPNEAVIQNFEKVKTILEKIAETRSLDPALMEEALTICDKYPQVLEVQYGSEQQSIGFRRLLQLGQHRLIARCPTVTILMEGLQVWQRT